MAGKFALTIILALLIGGCTTSPPLTLEERLEHEQDRKEKWELFVAGCRGDRGTIVSVDARRCYNRRGCVPSRHDWDFYYLKENPKRDPRKPDWKPRGGNNIGCWDQRSVREMIRRL